MQGVSRKQGESFENMMRRFNRKVQQSGIVTEAKRRQYHEKDISKREQRTIAIRKRARKEAKATAMLMKGL